MLLLLNVRVVDVIELSALLVVEEGVWKVEMSCALTTVLGPIRMNQLFVTINLKVASFSWNRQNNPVITNWHLSQTRFTTPTSLDVLWYVIMCVLKTIVHYDAFVFSSSTSTIWPIAVVLVPTAPNGEDSIVQRLPPSEHWWSSTRLCARYSGLSSVRTFRYWHLVRDISNHFRWHRKARLPT